MQLKLYDGVLIPPDGKFPAMTGVIVYKKDATIGIRLTEESEGMGDHSGCVDGVDYFECPVNSGILTTEDKVDPRELTFAEEGLIRSLVKPKPAYSTPIFSSIPISGLSPAALARMMQLNQRMGITTPTSGRNKLPPSTTNDTGTGINTPTPAPPTPQLQDPATRSRSNASATSACSAVSISVTSVAPTFSSSPQEPALEEEKPAEKKLSRLEILRQKKEAIRKRKLALQERVVETKRDKKEQEEQQQIQLEKEEAAPASTVATSPLQPTDTQASKSSVPSTVTPVVAQDAAMQDEVASIKSKTSKGSSGSIFSKASRCSRDSIVRLWITELRQESPDSAERYDLEDAENLLLEEDEHEIEDVSRIPSTSSIEMQQILRQPYHKDDHRVHVSQREGHEDLGNQSQESDLLDNGSPKPFRQSSLSRLQQLRQKKRLLEALPASIQTPMAPLAIAADVVLENVVPLSLNTSTMSRQHNNSLAKMAMASAAVLGHPTNENSARFPTQSRDRVQDLNTDATEDTDDNDTLSPHPSDDIMEEDMSKEDDQPLGEVHDTVPAAFQESVNITPSSSNPLPAFSEESTATATATATAVEPPNHLKRRRILGLGFLPGFKRHQKRQNIGQGQEQQ